MKTTVYICGPITDIEGGNFTAFNDAQIQLESLGYNVINPHIICKDFVDAWLLENPSPDEKSKRKLHRGCMRICLPEVLESNIVATLEGFQKSQGCKMEISTAREYPEDIEVINIVKLAGIPEVLYRQNKKEVAA
jgi:hypothetical protein